MPVVVGAILGGGCQSVVKSHQKRIERMYSIHEEVVQISHALHAIGRTMVYAGRVQNGPLADAALEVALEVHGQPDDAEKTYAHNITLSLIDKDRGEVKRLQAKRRQLKAILLKENLKLRDDFADLNQLEGKYNFASKIISRCLLFIGGLALVLLLKRFFF